MWGGGKVGGGSGEGAGGEVAKGRGDEVTGVVGGDVSEDGDAEVSGEEVLLGVVEEVVAGDGGEGGFASGGGPPVGVAGEEGIAEDFLSDGHGLLGLLADGGDLGGALAFDGGGVESGFAQGFEHEVDEEGGVFGEAGAEESEGVASGEGGEGGAS